MSKRGNREGSIYERFDKNGQSLGWAGYAWVTTPLGKRARKYVYGPDRPTVHRKLVELQNEAEERPIPTSTPTLAVYLAEWLENVIKPDSAANTYVTYESMTRLHIVPYLGHRRLEKLTVANIREWLTKLRSVCQCCCQGVDAGRAAEKQKCCAVGDCCKAVLSARKLRDVRGALRSALTQAIQDELIKRNVAQLAKPPKAKSNGRPPRRKGSWTTEEATAFLESARRDEDPLYAAYVLIIVLGLRKGEVSGLMWDNIDFDGEVLTPERQIQRVGRQLLLTPLKTDGSETDLPLPKICATALLARMDQQGEDELKAGEAWQNFGLIFTTRYGTPIEPRNFLRSWDARCEKAGVPRITVHDGRRTCASLLVDLGVHPRQVMRVLRHAKFSLTMDVYAKPSLAKTRAVLDRLSDSLG